VESIIITGGIIVTDQPTMEELNAWHKRFAMSCNNESWALIEKPERTDAEGREMLYLAYAAAYHWSKVGTPVNWARAEITLAHAYSLLGDGARAMQFAQSALAFFEAGNGEDWDLAFAHLEVALAAATQGDSTQHRLHYQQARDQSGSIQDPEDQKILYDFLGRIPSP
jgi:hypothetical protein